MEWMRRQDHRLGSVYKMKEDQEYTEESRGSLSGEIERRALSTPLEKAGALSTPSRWGEGPLDSLE